MGSPAISLLRSSRRHHGWCVGTYGLARDGRVLEFYFIATDYHYIAHGASDGSLSRIKGDSALYKS